MSSSGWGWWNEPVGGVDLIYRGLLRYGRPRPDYSRSDSSSVVLRMPISDADLPFLRLIVDVENRTQVPLPIDSLSALSLFRERRRISRNELQQWIQSPPRGHPGDDRSQLPQRRSTKARRHYPSDNYDNYRSTYDNYPRQQWGDVVDVTG